MSQRNIEAVKFNGETIYVEVTEADDYEQTSTESQLVNTGEQVRSTISAVAATVQQAFEKALPTEWTLELTLGFKGKAGIPFITEGEANGAVKVTAKWTRS